MTVFIANLSNGDQYTVDTDRHTITAAAFNAETLLASQVGDLADNLLRTGKPIGPQVDEFTGVLGTWDDPRAPLLALVDAARRARLSVVTYLPAVR